MAVDISVVPGSFKHVFGYKELWARSGAYKIKIIERCRPSKKAPLEFSVQIGDGWDRKDGIFISSITFGSIFDMYGLLCVGEEIVKIDGQDVKDMSMSQAVRYLYDNTQFKIHVKVPTPFAKKRIGTKRAPKERDGLMSTKVDHKILNMRILPPRTGRHVYEEPPPAAEGGDGEPEEE